MFIPARIPLFEFDDAAPVRGQRLTGARTIPSWQGPANEPAEEVCLAWIGPNQQQIVVSTASLLRHLTPYDRRHNAAFVLLGGSQLQLLRSPKSPAETHARIEEVSRREGAWLQRNVQVDAHPVAAYTAELDEALIGYLEVDRRIACFAALALPPAMIRLRTLTSEGTASYPFDPTTSFHVDGLNR